jgi:hypothetical protein
MAACRRGWLSQVKPDVAMVGGGTLELAHRLEDLLHFLLQFLTFLLVQNLLGLLFPLMLDFGGIVLLGGGIQLLEVLVVERLLKLLATARRLTKSWWSVSSSSASRNAATARGPTAGRWAVPPADGYRRAEGSFAWLPWSWFSASSRFLYL